MKKSIRILATVLVLIMTLATFTGCGLSPKAAAEAVVKNTFNALMSQNVEKIKNELQATEIFNEQLDEYSDVMIELLFKNLSYKIHEVEIIDKETVEVSLSITNTDMKSVFTEFVEKITAYALDNLDKISNMTEEETVKLTFDMLEECMSNSEHGTVTLDIVATVVKNDGEWQLRMDEKLIDAILGGFVTASENMNS